MAEEYECFCGDRFNDREQLIQHNVAQHDMSEQQSRDAVMDKYPQ